MSVEKLTTLAEAGALVRDGDTVAIQNMATQAAPMALVRELIRQGRQDLGVVCLVGGIPVDWLAAAGTINRLVGAAVSMEQFGLCQRYRKAVEAGAIRVEELSETALNARLGAGARNLPFLPTRGLIGTDLIGVNDNLVMLDDPFGGPPVVACRALVPDVALVHAHKADRFGNIGYEPTALWPDLGIMPKAATTVIVTAEEIVDSEVLRADPDRTVLPGFMVDAVVEVPYGAHPTSFFPCYGYDSVMHREWIGATGDDAKVAAFLETHVTGPADHTDYLETVGGAERLAATRAWEA
ncbi:CoA transferase subunit A [Candidatus Poriferisocius sp.]|uniref:CoA transferase subunit A n=1 Tax=Candidatus Poriferisocius sp. TaxID=3101276 RepID=UPI003B015575